MTESAVLCAAGEPQLTRVLRLTGIALLTMCSVALAVLTRPTIEFPTVITFLRLAAFVAALGMLASSVAAFWWRDAALRRVEWAAYVGLALLVAEQFATGPNARVLSSGPVRPLALIFALLAIAVVLARVCRRQSAPACHCS